MHVTLADNCIASTSSVILHTCVCFAHAQARPQRHRASAAPTASAGGSASMAAAWVEKGHCEPLLHTARMLPSACTLALSMHHPPGMWSRVVGQLLMQCRRALVGLLSISSMGRRCVSGLLRTWHPRALWNVSSGSGCMAALSVPMSTGIWAKASVALRGDGKVLAPMGSLYPPCLLDNAGKVTRWLTTKCASSASSARSSSDPPAICRSTTKLAAAVLGCTPSSSAAALSPSMGPRTVQFRPGVHVNSMAQWLARKARTACISWCANDPASTGAGASTSTNSRHGVVWSSSSGPAWLVVAAAACGDRLARSRRSTSAAWGVPFVSMRAHLTKLRTVGPGPLLLLACFRCCLHVPSSYLVLAFLLNSRKASSRLLLVLRSANETSCHDLYSVA